MREILLLALVFFACASLSAQVTIGGLEEPKSGAVLDLNSTLKGGLLLSNVELPNLYTIPHTGTANPFPGVTAANHESVKAAFAGVMVYHTGGYNIPAGIYVWNGTNWTSVEENCAPPALTLTAPFLVEQGIPVAFSVASDASARCAEGETYKWYVSGDNGNTYSSLGSGASVTTSFAAEGVYKVKAVLTSPYSSISIEKIADVTVTASGAPTPAMLNNTYGIVGETCLDVKKSAQGKTSDVFNARTDAFKDGFTKKYRFVYGNNYENLLFFFDDPDSLVAGITYPPASSTDGSSGEKEFSVTFKSNIKDLVPDNGDSLTVKLYASYKPAETPTVTKYAYLEIRVEDGTCICPAKTGINPDTWLNFMCHNLGGLDIISASQLITREHHGDWYRFGAPQASMKNTPAHDTNNNWDYSGYSSSGWPNTTCPAGWRVPTMGEWSNVGNPGHNPQSAFPASWVGGVAVYLKKLGDDLYFPAAGVRNGSDGKLGGRGTSCFFWTSNGQSSTMAVYVYFNSASTQGQYISATPIGDALSVRCVEK